MSIIDKKQDIISVLKSTKDEELIENIYQLIHPEKSIEEIDINGLPKSLRNKVEAALDDYKAGNYITHDQMKQKVQQWLMK